MQVGIQNLITITYVFSLRILKFNKTVGWNKGVQVEKLLFNKICCTVIRETKVVSKTTVALNRVMKTGEHASQVSLPLSFLLKGTFVSRRCLDDAVLVACCLSLNYFMRNRKRYPGISSSFLFYLHVKTAQRVDH